ncbi:acyl-CoA thioester hydrolase [Selenomonas sp. GACV-9]|uniref:acyl-CoA thioesterase n=1 Tax=Selenomonas sp. GACV-9 TaxID=3158782 RepID=UPI0008E7C40F|nr:acyl-CoA thioester hydrolase [Selenomonas ruminantium]
MPVITEHHVNFYDTDAMAVVHHSNYIRWFEIGRVEYLRSIGITLGELMDDGFVFPITDVRAKYVSPGKFDDVVLIETTPTALTKAKMAFDYRIIRKADGEVMVTGHSQNVFTSKETGRITRLPEKYYRILAAAMAKEKTLQLK